MFLFYVDESGSPRPHSEPLLNGQTPIFVLAALALHADQWRFVDRSYRALKVRFFQREIGTRRPEQYEVKGTELIGPHNRTSRRRHAFVRRVMRLCTQVQMKGFAVIFRKDPQNPTSSTSMYTMALQYLVERFNKFLEETCQGLTPGFNAQPSQGIIVADTRLNNLDLNVAVSHLTFIFGNPVGQQCQQMIEAPTFTFSQLSVGLQLTDIFTSCMYARAYRRHCHGIAGGFDYSHMAYFDRFAENLEFRSQLMYDGYYTRGYRFIGFGP
ncbi:MAG: DUF3800 domain-containing protein [Terriglobia bacterium]